MSTRKPYNDLAGYVASRHNIINNGWVVIYVAAEQGMDVGEKYMVSCELHGALVGVSSVAKARPRLKVPDFCEECMADARREGVTTMEQSTLCECGVSKRKHDTIDVLQECYMRLTFNNATCDDCGLVMTWNGDTRMICDECGDDRDFHHGIGRHYDAFA